MDYLSSKWSFVSGRSFDADFGTDFNVDFGVDFGADFWKSGRFWLDFLKSAGFSYLLQNEVKAHNQV